MGVGWNGRGWERDWKGVVRDGKGWEGLGRDGRGKGNENAKSPISFWTKPSLILDHVQKSMDWSIANLGFMTSLGTHIVFIRSKIYIELQDLS